MEFFNSFVEWFNGLVGLEYAGYGPITAIAIGITTVIISIRVLKFFFRPFAPLFQADIDLGESNPVLAQQGIRQSQLMDQNDDRHDISGRFERSRQRSGRTRGQLNGHETLSSANDAEAMDFGEALEDAWQHDQSTELREEIAPLRPIPSRTSANGATNGSGNGSSQIHNLRPTAASSPVQSVPILRISNFGDTSRSSGAAQRMALRLQQGVSTTLARIPNLAVESAETANGSAASEPAFNVEGKVDLADGGIRVAIAVRSSVDGSHLLARDMTCKPADMQKFEKEVALEIASAVIAHQRSAGQSVMKHLASSRTPPQGARSGSKYPSARHPSPEHHHRTDRPGR